MKTNTYFGRLLLLAAGAFLLAGCDGKDGKDGMDGADGQDGVDTGTISVTVTSGGNAVEGATVSTNPASTLFPVSGWAVLRAGDGSATEFEDQVQVIFDVGPYRRYQVTLSR